MLAIGWQVIMVIGISASGAVKAAWPIVTLTLPLFYLVGVLQLEWSPQSDSLGYYSTALALSGSTGEVVETVQVSGKDGYVRLLSVVFRFGEASMTTPIAVNAVFLALTALVLVNLTQSIVGVRPAKVAPTVFALSVPVVVWGTQGLREAAVFFGISITMASFLNLMRRKSTGWLLAWLASLWFLFMFRGAIAAVLAFGCICALVLMGRRASRLAGGVVVGAALLLWLFVLPRITYFATLQSAYFDADRVEVVRDSLQTANSGFQSDITSPMGFLATLLRVVLGPFPWEWGAYPTAIPDVLYWWVAMIVIFRTLVKKNLPPGSGLLLVGSAAILIAVTTGVTNYGMLLRVRAMVIVPLIPLLAFSVCAFRTRTRRNMAALAGGRLEGS